jgi:hypothetical protein
MKSPEKTIRAVIAQRKRLIQIGKSQKNTALCFAMINRIEILLEAYGKKYTPNQWNRFLERHKSELNYLIPNNKAGDSVREKLQIV